MGSFVRQQPEALLHSYCRVKIPVPTSNQQNGGAGGGVLVW